MRSKTRPVTSVIAVESNSVTVARNYRALYLATFAVVLVAALAQPRASADNYQVTQLGAGAGADSKLFAINRYGQAVGWALQEDGNHHGIHFQNGGLEDLDNTTHFVTGALFTEHYSEAFDISNSDQIVGTALVTFDCDPTTIVSYRAFIHQPATSDGPAANPGDSLVDLGALGFDCDALNSVATAISNNNHIVGWADVNAGRSRAFILVPVNGEYRRDLDGDGINDFMVNLGSLGAADGVSSATGVNDNGWIVGYSYTAAKAGRPEGYHGFLIVPQDTDNDGIGDQWVADINGDGANDLMADLGTLGGTNSWARAINNGGQIAGESDTLDGHTHAFIWQNGVMTDLGTLGGQQSSATGINGFGQVVGWAETAAGQRRGFIWQNGTMTDLNAVTPAGGPVRVVEARDINDAGQIAAWGVLKSDTDQTPVACILDIAVGDTTADGTVQSDDSNTNAGTSAPVSSPLDLLPLLPGPQSQVLGETDTTSNSNSGNSTALCGAGLLGFVPLTALGIGRTKRQMRR